MSKKKYDLVGVDGNIFAVIGYTTKAMRETGYSSQDVDSFRNTVTKSDCYEKALGLCISKVEECNERLNKPKKSKNNHVVKDRNEEELNDYFSVLFDKYVPIEGKSDTVGGEIVRAISRISYRWFNDGDYAGYGYGLETAGSQATYLYSEFEEFEDAVERLINIVEDDESYNNALIDLENVVAKYLDVHPEVFETENDCDSYDDYSECIYDSEIEEREHYFDDSWDDEEDDDYEDDDEYEEDDEWDDENN